jgi:hypothetical protein
MPGSLTAESIEFAKLFNGAIEMLSEDKYTNLQSALVNFITKATRTGWDRDIPIDAESLTVKKLICLAERTLLMVHSLFDPEKPTWRDVELVKQEFWHFCTWHTWFLRDEAYTLMQEVDKIIPTMGKKNFDAVIEEAVNILKSEPLANNEEKAISDSKKQSLTNLASALELFNNQLQQEVKEGKISATMARFIAFRTNNLAKKLINSKATPESKEYAILDFYDCVMPFNDKRHVLGAVGILVTGMAIAALLAFCPPVGLLLGSVFLAQMLGMATVLAALVGATVFPCLLPTHVTTSSFFKKPLMPGVDKVVAAVKECSNAEPLSLNQRK